jgi:hypothetical protein
MHAALRQNNDYRDGDSRLGDGRCTAAIGSDQPESRRRRFSAEHWCRVRNDRGTECNDGGSSTATGERAANAAQVRHTAVFVLVVVARVRVRRCNDEPQAQYRRQQAADATLPGAAEYKCGACHCLQRRSGFFECESTIAHLIVASSMRRRAFRDGTGRGISHSCSANFWRRPPSRTTNTV